MNITREKHDELIALIEDSVEYFCNENMVSGELVYTILNCYSEYILFQVSALLSDDAPATLLIFCVPKQSFPCNWDILFSQNVYSSSTWQWLAMALARAGSQAEKRIRGSGA